MPPRGGQAGRASTGRDDLPALALADSLFARGRGRRPVVGGGAGGPQKAESPVSLRPMISFWIWVVPSGMLSMRASRSSRSSGNSVARP